MFKICINLYAVIQDIRKSAFKRCYLGKKGFSILILQHSFVPSYFVSFVFLKPVLEIVYRQIE